MLKIRKAAEFRRVTVGQELMEVLGPEDGAPDGAYREVQLLTPASPPMVFTIDHPTPAEAGPDRKYDLPPAPPAQRIPVRLRADQRIYAAAQTTQAFAFFVIEYLEDS